MSSEKKQVDSSWCLAQVTCWLESGGMEPGVMVSKPPNNFVPTKLSPSPYPTSGLSPLHRSLHWPSCASCLECPSPAIAHIFLPHPHSGGF